MTYEQALRSWRARNPITWRRVELGQTQPELSASIEISQPHLLKWERGKLKPQLSNLHFHALAKALGCDVHELSHELAEWRKEKPIMAEVELYTELELVEE